MDNVLKVIKKLNIRDEYVVLACSYGPDSMVLLDILIKENINVVVAHVNHKLRKESEEEKLLLEKYCKDNNLIFELFEIDNYPKGNFEMNARNLRYDFFEKILKKYNSKYLFTAHHGDDLVETVLMRLSRGSSFKGYAGFNILSKKRDYRLVRPLVYLTKENILDYANNNNISYAIDHTNKENLYTRNRFRNNIVIELKKENKNIHKKFIKYNEMINTYEEYFVHETNNLFNQLYKGKRIDINEFTLLDKLFQKRLLEKILFTVYEEKITSINDKHIEMIIDLIFGDKQNSYVELPNNVRVTKFYNIIEFDYHEDKTHSYNYILSDKVTVETGTISYTNENLNEKSNYIIRLNSSEIKLPIRVRTRKDGDRIAVKNLKGTKKINDIFIDSKMPAYLRKTYPIVTDNDDVILWIPGVKKSKLDKQKDESYDIIIKYEKKGEAYEEK